MHVGDNMTPIDPSNYAQIQAVKKELNSSQSGQEKALLFIKENTLYITHEKDLTRWQKFQRFFGVGEYSYNLRDVRNYIKDNNQLLSLVLPIDRRIQSYNSKCCHLSKISYISFQEDGRVVLNKSKESSNEVKKALYNKGVALLEKGEMQQGFDFINDATNFRMTFFDGSGLDDLCMGVAKKVNDLMGENPDTKIHYLLGRECFGALVESQKNHKAIADPFKRVFKESYDSLCKMASEDQKKDLDACYAPILKIIAAEKGK